MNVRTVALSLMALAALSAGVVACGGKSSTDKTKAAASGTPGANLTASTSATANKTGTSTTTAHTPAAASGTPVPIGTVSGPNTGPGGSPAADVTVDANGTATNAQGTPVPLPTVSVPGATPAAGATAAASATVPAGAKPPIDPTIAPGPTPGPAATVVPGSAPRLTVEAPASVSGDFSVSVRLDGLSQPYYGFNIYLTFDAAVVDATGSAAGTTLASSPDQMFCTKLADKIPGAEGLGCTLLGTKTSNNGVLATFTFKRIGSGVAVIHMSSYAQSGALGGSYIAVNSDPDPVKSNPIPLDVALTDAVVTVS